MVETMIDAFCAQLTVAKQAVQIEGNVGVDDIVLLIDANANRSKWVMGKVKSIYRGNDGHVRSVQVKTKDGIYDRPITKLSLLLSKNEYQNGEQNIFTGGVGGGGGGGMVQINTEYTRPVLNRQFN